jgi:cytoskeletal protein RodZ
MATARNTDEAVSSGSETMSGNKNDSGAKSRNGTEATPKQPDPGVDTQPPSAINNDSGSPTPSSPSAEPSKAAPEGEPSLGKTLAAARERHGLSRADIVAETRIPAHYIEMIESSDYGLISDSLYLMPFLRRYAAFLDLDGEEVAMRFVREVQRAELAAVAAPRMSEPFILRDHKRPRWGRVVMVVIVLSAIVVLYLIASEHHRGEFGFHQSTPPAAPTEPNAAIPPAAAPVLPVAPAPMTAPPPMAAPAPQAAAPAPLPKTSVVGGPKALAVGGQKAPAGTRLRKPPPSRTISPSNNE